MGKENKEQRYHITVTDNKTGETYLDTDACAIVGGVNTGDGAVSMASVDCDANNFAYALASAEEVLNRIYGRNPELEGLAALCRLKRKAEKATTENNQ